MPELTREEKLKLVEKLPQQLQDFLYSEDTGAFLLYLGQKYNLPDEKVRLLSKLAGDVVLGITPITSLAQEINSKITSDIQAAMHLAQELNIELLAPVMAPMPAPATLPTLSPTSSEQFRSNDRESSIKSGQSRGSSISQPNPKDLGEIGTKPVDQYRELAPSVPEIIDLRNQPKAGPPRAEMPPPATSLPPKPAPTLPTLSPTSSEQFRSNDRESSIKSGQSRGSSIPKPNPKDLGGIGTTSPLTFTRPIEPVKLAPQPPLIEAEPHQKPIDAYREPQPQYIMRPSGAPPTDSPENVLDLRKDKGEF